MWQAKREEVFRRFGKKCAKCGSQKLLLSVHHKTYNAGKLPWEYPIENFEVLCERCHKETHSLPYTTKYCEICNKVISEKYSYCFECHSKQIKRLQEEKIALESTIKGLNNQLQFQNETKNKVNHQEISRLQNELKKIALNKEKVEKALDSVKDERDKIIEDNKRTIAEKLVIVKHLQEEKERLTLSINNLNEKLQQQDQLTPLDKKQKIAQLQNEINKILHSKKEIEASLQDIEIERNKIVEDNKRIMAEKLEMENNLINFDKARREDTMIVKSHLSSLRNLVIGLIILISSGIVGFVIYFQKTIPINSSTTKEVIAQTSPEPNSDKIPTEEIKPSLPIKTGNNPQALFDSKNKQNIIDITKDMKGQKVFVSGKIENRRDHNKGHVFLDIKDSTGNILVPIFANKGIDAANMQVGKVVNVTGMIDIYQDQLEIIPNSSSDILILENEQAITNIDIGKTVTVTANVLSVYKHPAGHIFLTVMINDRNQEMKIPIFSSLGYQNPKLVTNCLLQISGKVSTYKDQLQIVPEKISDITILQEANIKNVEVIKIADIKEHHRGQVFKVKGKVAEYLDKNGHTFFTIEDDSKKAIKAVLFKADANELMARKRLISSAEKNGIILNFISTVDIYKGEMELIVDKVYK